MNNRPLKERVQSAFLNARKTFDRRLAEASHYVDLSEIHAPWAQNAKLGLDLYLKIRDRTAAPALAPVVLRQVLEQECLANDFIVTKTQVKSHVNMMSEGVCYFHKATGGRASFDPDDSYRIWLSAEFDEKGIYNAFFEHHKAIKILPAKNAESYEPELSIRPIGGGSKHPLYGDAAERLETLIDKHGKYSKEGIRRTYLLLGPPGGGKTTIIEEWVRKVGARAVFYDNSALLGNEGIAKFLEMAGIDFLVLNDVDRDTRSTGKILAALETLNKVTTVVMTANRLSPLGEAFRRPGRVDEVHLFQAPDTDERKAVIAAYLTKYEVTLNPDTLDAVVILSEGMTQAYLKEIAIQARFLSELELLEYIALQQMIRNSPSAFDSKDEGSSAGEGGGSKDGVIGDLGHPFATDYDDDEDMDDDDNY